MPLIKMFIQSSLSSASSSSSSLPPHPHSLAKAPSAYPTLSHFHSFSHLQRDEFFLNTVKMKYAAALLAAAVGAHAWGNGTLPNATVTTEVVDKFITYCPGPTHLTHNGKIYNITTAMTVTLDCPCTIEKPVYSTPVVVCNTPACNNGSVPIHTNPIPTNPIPTTTAPTSVPTAGAVKAAALSGAGLAGVVGLAAFVL